jgi:hypothetical protein
MSQISGKQINNNSVNLSKLSGDGNVSFGNNTVVEFLTDAKLYYVDTPTELGEVTNKEYVDQKILDSINNAFILTYISKWNPITNTPTLTDSDISRRGEVYRASEQSTIFSIAWNIGDYLVYNENGIIEVSRNSDNVLSVNGEIGDVVLDLDWELKTDGVSRNNISPDSGINLVSGNNITLTYDNTSNNNSITIDSELTENPFGLEGQIYKIQTDNTNTIQAEDSIVEGNYIRSSDELSDAQLNPTTFTSFQEVFNTWQRFSHNSSTIPANVNETQQWNYTSGIDQINTTVNSTTHIGFVSDIPLSSYTLNTTLTSPGSDDDGICIVIAYVEDENDLVSNQAFGLDQASYPGLNTTDEFVPNQHTITVILSRGGLNGSLSGSATSEYVIIYDFKKDTEQLLENGGSLIETPTTNSWNGAEIDVRVERDGNIITTSVLNFSDLTQDVTFEDTELTIDLNSLPILEKFKGPARYGFSSLSQLNSTYKNISISGSGLNEIYDLRTGEIYEADSSGTWTINTSRNLDNELLKRNIIFNPNFRTLLWYKGIGNFVTISENFEFFEGNISIDWDQVQNKPTLDNYASWNLKSNGFQRTGIFSDDSIDLVEGDGIDISYSAGGVINIASTFSESVLGLDYNNSTGILSTTTGYEIPTLTKQSQWDTSYNDDIESIAVTGTNTKTITLTQRDGSIISTQWTDLDSLPDGDEYINALSFSSTTGVLTAGRTGNLPDITASLDGRYSLLNHTNEDLTPGTGLSGDIYNGSSARTFAVIYGTTANTTTEGNDFRLSNARTPLAHSLASHEDVTISSNTNGEILKWTGTAWINNTLSQAGIQPAGNYDNYASWNLKIGGTSRKTITSGNDVNFVAGDNISISYLAGGTVSISSSAVSDDNSLPTFATVLPNSIGEIYRSPIGTSVRELGNIIQSSIDDFYYHVTTFVDAKGIQNIRLLKSIDLVTWTDEGIIVTDSEDPYLIENAGSYYLYVEDKEPVVFRNIKLYTSTDLSTWTDEGVILDYNDAPWESQDVSSPAIIIEGGTWYMYYEGRAAPNQDGAIGLATSTDGINWVKNSNNPIYTGTNLNSDLKWADHLVPDDIIKSNGLFYMTAHAKVLEDNEWFEAILVSRDLENWVDTLGTWSNKIDYTDESGYGLMIFQSKEYGLLASFINEGDGEDQRSIIIGSFGVSPNYDLKEKGIKAKKAEFDHYVTMGENNSPLPIPSFEQNFSSSLSPFTTSGDATWTRVTNEGNGDNFSARSGNISDRESSVLTLVQNLPEGTSALVFDYKTSSEASFDYLEIRINDINIKSYSGNTSWSTSDKIFIKSNGEFHKIDFIYWKDNSSDGGTDQVWIDNVKIYNNYKPSLDVDGSITVGKDLYVNGSGSFRKLGVGGDFHVTGKQKNFDSNGRLFLQLEPNTIKLYGQAQQKSFDIFGSSTSSGFSVSNASNVIKLQFSTNDTIGNPFLDIKGDVIAEKAILNSAINTSVSLGEAKYDAFGFIGNRQSVYFTNQVSSGNIKFCIGGVHNTSVQMTIESDGSVTARNFIGNGSLITNVDASSLNGLSIAGANANIPWPFIPDVGADGLMEIGRYIDFHLASNSGVDNNGRLALTSDKNLNWNGNFTADNFFEGSDKRLKTNIKKISKSVYSYELKTQPGITVYGTIAQEIEKTNPGVVKKPEDGGMMSVNYNSFLSLKLAEQENENKEQNNKIDSLQQQIDELKELIKN